MKLKLNTSERNYSSLDTDSEMPYLMPASSEPKKSRQVTIYNNVRDSDAGQIIFRLSGLLTIVGGPDSGVGSFAV